MVPAILVSIRRGWSAPERCLRPRQSRHVHHRVAQWRAAVASGWRRVSAALDDGDPLVRTLGQAPVVRVVPAHGACRSVLQDALRLAGPRIDQVFGFTDLLLLEGRSLL